MDACSCRTKVTICLVAVYFVFTCYNSACATRCQPVGCVGVERFKILKIIEVQLMSHVYAEMSQRVVVHLGLKQKQSNRLYTNTS